MSFDDSIERVRRAERALDASGRAVAGEWMRVRQVWREAWTPGRIVIAGLASGFVIGRSEMPTVTGSGFVNLVSALGGLFAVDDVTTNPEATTEASAGDVPQDAADAMGQEQAAPGEDDVLRTHEALRRSGAW